MSYYTPRVPRAEGSSVPPKKPQRNEAKKVKEQKVGEKKEKTSLVSQSATVAQPKQEGPKKVSGAAEKGPAEGQEAPPVAAVGSEPSKKTRSQKKKEKIAAKKNQSKPSTGGEDASKTTSLEVPDAKKAKKKRPGKKQRMQFAKTAQ
jgi:hypothetical protein